MSDIIVRVEAALQGQSFMYATYLIPELVSELKSARKELEAIRR